VRDLQHSTSSSSSLASWWPFGALPPSAGVSEALSQRAETELTLPSRVNYGCLLHVPAPAVYVVPLALQALPAV